MTFPIGAIPGIGAAIGTGGVAGIDTTATVNAPGAAAGGDAFSSILASSSGPNPSSPSGSLLMISRRSASGSTSRFRSTRAATPSVSFVRPSRTCSVPT